MTDGQNNNGGGGASGPWDLLMILVRQFPNVAVLCVIVGGAFYIYQNLAEQNRKAEAELQKAKDRISELEQKATKALNDAREKEQKASEALANAKIEANKEVQKQQIATAKEIQKLVAGQLATMKEFEDLRSTATLHLREEIAALRQEKTEIEKTLSRQNMKLEIADTLSAINRLEDAIQRERYEIFKRIEDVNESFDAADIATMAEIERIISENPNVELTLSLELALLLKSKQYDRIEKILGRLDNMSRADAARWLGDIFECCGRFDDAIWDGFANLVFDLTVSDELDINQRINLIDFLHARQNTRNKPLFQFEKYRMNPRSWNIVEFLTDIARGKHPETPAYYVDDVARHLMRFDVAAMHVWAHQLLAGDLLDDNARQSLQDFIRNNLNRYPILSKDPAPELVAFWTSENLSAQSDRYLSEGTNNDYLPAAN